MVPMYQNRENKQWMIHYEHLSLLTPMVAELAAVYKDSNGDPTPDKARPLCLSVGLWFGSETGEAQKDGNGKGKGGRKDKE